MGIDCCFGVFSEPVILAPPMAEGGTAEAAKEAMRILPFTLGLSRLGSFIVDYPWLYLP
jgi:hypothetical protein